MPRSKGRMRLTTAVFQGTGRSMMGRRLAYCLAIAARHWQING